MTVEFYLLTLAQKKIQKVWTSESFLDVKAKLKLLEARKKFYEAYSVLISDHASRRGTEHLRSLRSTRAEQPVQLQRPGPRKFFAEGNIKQSSIEVGSASTNPEFLTQSTSISRF